MDRPQKRETKKSAGSAIARAAALALALAMMVPASAIVMSSDASAQNCRPQQPITCRPHGSATRCTCG